MYLCRGERLGNIPPEDEKETERFDAIKTKIINEHSDEILKLLARKGYYEYTKDEEGKPVYIPTDMLIRKIMGGVMYVYKKDGYLNEIYVDDNEEELMQEGFHALLCAVVRCFPDVIFPDEWFGTWDKKKLVDVQINVIANVFASNFLPKKLVKNFFKNEFHKNLQCLLDWYIDVKKVSESRAFSIVAGEIGKSTSYVRDHYNDAF